MIKLQRNLTACSDIGQSLYGYFKLVICTFGSVAKVCEAVELMRMDVTSDPSYTILIAFGIADIPKMLV